MIYKTINYIIIFISICTSVFSFSYLPESVPSHWNYLGEVDAYSSKLSQAILFPGLLVFLLALLFIVPKLDPLKKNIEKFDNHFQAFITSLLLFFVLVQLQTVLWSFGYEISPNIFFPILMGGLFFQIGNLLEKAKRNWTIGIRTPWTLSSDYVWEKTHKLGGKLFKYSVFVMLISLFFPSYTFIFVIGYVLLSTLFITIYSFVIFKSKQGS